MTKVSKKTRTIAKAPVTRNVTGTHKGKPVLAMHVTKPEGFDMTSYVARMATLNGTVSKGQDVRKAAGESISAAKLRSYAETVVAIVKAGVEAWNKTLSNEARTLMKAEGVPPAAAKRYTEGAGRLLKAKPELAAGITGNNSGNPCDPVLSFFAAAKIRTQKELETFLYPKEEKEEAVKMAEAYCAKLDKDGKALFAATVAKIEADKAKIEADKARVKEAARAQAEARKAAKAGDKALKAREIEARREGNGTGK